MNIPTKQEKIDLKIKECQFYISHPDFFPILEDFIPKLYLNGCNLGFDFSNPRCKASRHVDTPNSGCIIWLYNTPHKEQSEILWDLFHEFGHHQDQIKISKKDLEDIEKVKTREIRAWEYANKTFEGYSELQKYRSQYEKYKEKCLASYFKV